MGKRPVSKIIFLVFFVFMAVHYAHSGQYNEDTCFKDCVSAGGKDMVVAVNRDTNQIVSVWSDKDQAWSAPEKDYQNELQKLYNKKIQLREMQSNLNDMHRETWYDTNENNISRR